MRSEIECQNLVWVDILKPDANDVEYVQKRFKIHPLTAKMIIPPIHYPDLDSFDDYLFLILRYPSTKDSPDIKIREFDVIAGKDFLITNHQEEILPIRQLFEACQESPATKNDFTGKGGGYLLYIILNAFLKDKFAKINDVVQRIEKIEERIFSEPERELVREISALKTQIIDFWRIVHPQLMIFENLESVGAQFYGEEFGHYFSSILQVHRRIENTLKSAKETIEALEQTNHILVSVRLAETMKVLTLWSLIFLPLTLLASVWGMNTRFLPFHDTQYDFLFIVIIMVATATTMLWFFRSKKWI